MRQLFTIDDLGRRPDPGLKDALNYIVRVRNAAEAQRRRHPERAARVCRSCDACCDVLAALARADPAGCPWGYDTPGLKRIAGEYCAKLQAWRAGGQEWLAAVAQLQHVSRML